MHFLAFHTLITQYSAMDRQSFLEARDALIYQVMQDVVEHAFEVREGSRQSTQGDDLPHWQQCWLLHAFGEDRAISDAWLDEVSEGCANWFVREYERRVKDGLSFGSAEVAEIINVFSRFIIEHKELFA